MTDNPNVSTYVAEALKRAQLPISVYCSLAPGFDGGVEFCVHDHSTGSGMVDDRIDLIRSGYISLRTHLIREQQQVK